MAITSGGCLALEELGNFSRSEYEQRRRGQRPQESHLGYDERTDWEAVETITRGQCDEDGFPGRLADAIFTVPISFRYFFFSVGNQCIDSLFDGGWRSEVHIITKI